MRFVLLLLLPTLGFAQRFSGFDPTALDRAADPCVNFYQYACGAWMGSNPIPGDQSSWGRFNVLQEHNRTVLQSILENAETEKPGRTTVEREIGDYYSACMDEKTIDAKGLSAIKPDLDQINAIRDKNGITRLVIHLYQIGSAPFSVSAPHRTRKMRHRKSAIWTRAAWGCRIAIII